MNLVIEINEPRGIELPNVMPEVDSETGEVKAPGFHAQKLLPGENDVDSAYWNKVKGNGAVKQWLACGILENKGEGKARSLVASLDNISPNAALNHIGKCENVQVLNDWKAGTENRALRKAIEERILELVHAQTGDADAPASVVESTVTD